MPIRFIIIDNDPVNNLLCTLTIKDVQEAAEVQTFTSPVKGFEYLSQEYTAPTDPTVLLLDINMPAWSAWDFLDQFEKLDNGIKKQIKVYILSSSIDIKDKHRARENKNVEDYVEKPLSEKTVLSMFDQKWEPYYPLTTLHGRIIGKQSSN